jgi:hypothetical protein
MSLEEGREESREEVFPGNARRGDGHCPRFRIRSLDSPPRVREQRLRPQHVVREHSSRWRQCDAAPPSDDELAADLGLEGRHVLRDGRLADEELGGRS